MRIPPADFSLSRERLNDYAYHALAGAAAGALLLTVGAVSYLENGVPTLLVSVVLIVLSLRVSSTSCACVSGRRIWQQVRGANPIDWMMTAALSLVWVSPFLYVDGYPLLAALPPVACVLCWPWSDR